MRAMQVHAIGKPLILSEIPVPDEKEGFVTVRLKCAALNRRDYWIQQGQYPRINLPVTPGSDGAGIVDGRDVIIDPGLNWGDNEKFQSADFRILGLPEHGTLAEVVAMPKENVYDKPAHLSWEEAAAIPLAGVTAYRALFVQGEAQPGEKVLISGIGGGVALTAMQLALAHGLEVGVTSGKDEKLERAKRLGASYTANYKSADWVKALSDQSLFDIVLDSAGGEGFGHLQKLVKPGGRIIVYGGTLGKITNLSPQMLYWRQITIKGSTMGSPTDFQSMLAFVKKHRIKPIIDSVFDLEETNAALEKMHESSQFGKIVIRISS